MLKWLGQRLEKRKQKTRRLPETEIYISPVFKWLGRRAENRKQKAKRLWEREFNIVKAGLDEKQVISFINDLIEQHRSSQEASSESLRSLLKMTVTDAEQVAANIKMRAQAEAEAEAARIVAQAEQESQQIKREAEIAGQKDSEEIISRANTKAEIIEVEAKQNALLFLFKAREEIEKEIMEEYKQAHSRLFSSLQGLIGEGQNIEMELRGKRARLWESTNFELKQFEATLLSSSGASPPFPETSAATEIEMEPVQLEEEVLEEKVEEPVQLEEEVLEERVEESVQLQEEATVSEPVGGTMKELSEQYLPEERPGEREGEPTPLELDTQAPYAGEIEFEIAMPVDSRMVYKLYEHLQTVPELKILHTKGSWDGGTTIAIGLDKPTPLDSIISKILGVEVIPELSEKDGLAEGVSSSLRGARRSGVKRIKLTLKETPTL